MTGARIVTDFLSRTTVCVADLRGSPESTWRPQGCPQFMHSPSGVSAPTVHRFVHSAVCGWGRPLARLGEAMTWRVPAEVSRANAALARAARAEIAEERYERYCQLRRGGYTIQQAAWELRISLRHAGRYEARRKEAR